MTEILAELEAIRGDRPVSAEEVAFAHGSLTDGYAQRFETPFQIVIELLDEVLYGLPADTLEAFPKRVRSVTTEQVTEAARQYIHSDDMAIVIVGDVATIREPVEALELGPVVLLDRSGRPLEEE